MFQGELLAIYVAEAGGAPASEMSEAQLAAGKGVEGDRYACGAGTFSKADSDTDVTLIEIEALEAAEREHQVSLTPAEARRNLVTRNVPLNHLVGREFFVGTTKLRGVRLCDPCKHLERLTKYGVMKAFAHRGGLRAVIVEGGTIRAGDVIRPASSTCAPVND
jgi:MOSC domain-containing protein YiiM